MIVGSWHSDNGGSMTTRRQAAARAYAEKKYPDGDAGLYTRRYMQDLRDASTDDFLAGAEAEAAAGVECWVVEMKGSGTVLHVEMTRSSAEREAKRYWLKVVRIRPARLVLCEEGEKND